MKHRLSYWIVLAPIVIALGGSAEAWASECEGCTTIVPGPVVVNETWTSAGSPYCVTGPVTVGGLTIEPGVCVRVNGPYAITVATSITAIGTAEEPITFTEKEPSDNWRGLLFEDSGPGSVLEHCVITRSTNAGIRIDTGPGGFVPELKHCTIANNSRSGSGGGINAQVVNGPLSLIDCEIRNNTSTINGGGLALNVSGEIHLTRCRLEGNIANVSYATGNRVGGGVYLVAGDLFVDDSFFIANRANARCTSGAFGCTVTARGGAAYLTGGGVVEIRCTEFRSNVADARNNGNSCFEGHSNARGAAIYVQDAAVTASNCIFTCNQTVASGSACSPEFKGAGAYSNGGTTNIMNCTIASNSSHGIFRAGGTVDVRNSIVYYNNSGGTQISGSVTVEYCNVQGCFTGEGNICALPFFLNPTCSCPYFRIVDGSPCVDAGDPDPAFNDSGDCSDPPFGTERNDMGAHGGPGACWLPLDPSCPYDLNFDCVVGAPDLAILLGNWGPCPPEGDCPADIDGNGFVGPFDLALLLGFWGPCE